MANHPSTPILPHWSPPPPLISHQASGSSTPLGAALGIGSPSGHRRNGGCTGPRRARDRCRHREGWRSVLWRQMCQSEPQLTVRWTGHGGAGSEGVATVRARYAGHGAASNVAAEGALFSEPMACSNQFDEHMDLYKRQGMKIQIYPFDFILY